MFRLILAILILTLAVSCKKQEAETCTLKSSTDPFGNIDVYGIQNGKITSIKSGSATVNFDYNSSNHLTSIKRYYNGQLVDESKYINRTDGKVSQINSNSSYSPSSTSIFIYQNNVLHKEIFRSNGEVSYTYYVFEGDDVVEIRHYNDVNGQEVLLYTNYYTYGTELNPFYGMYPALDIKSYSRYLPTQVRAGAGSNATVNYTYTFDDKGLLTYETAVGNNGKPSTITYQHLCR